MYTLFDLKNVTSILKWFRALPILFLRLLKRLDMFLKKWKRKNWENKVAGRWKGSAETEVETAYLYG